MPDFSTAGTTYGAWRGRGNELVAVWNAMRALATSSASGGPWWKCLWVRPGLRPGYTYS